MQKLKLTIVVAALLAILPGGAQQPAPGAGQAQAPGAPAAAGGPRRGGFSEPDPIDFTDHAGWVSLFDGETLNGWEGNKKIWRVENGSIVAESTCEQPAGTTYLIWQGGEVADFELKAELRGEGAAINSGIQYRSFRQPPRQAAAGAGGAPGGAGGARGPAGACPSGQPRGTPDFAENAKWNLGGPQADFDGRNRFSGQYYEGGTGRGIVAWRGQVVRAQEGAKPRLLAELGNRDELGGYIRINDWNQIHIIARGNQMTHIINGHVMSVFLDDDPGKFRPKGLLALQIEGTGKVGFRNLWIRKQ